MRFSSNGVGISSMTSDVGDLRIMMDFISWYLESVSAFWVSLASGGLFKLILIACLIYWIFGRRARWRWRCHGHRCSHCGWWCGRCPCGAGEDGDDEDGNDEDGNDADGDDDDGDGDDDDGDGDDDGLVME